MENYCRRLGINCFIWFICINAISGVANAWVDSVPMLIISGQAHSELNEKSMVRQVGNKAISIVEIVKRSQNMQ